LLKSNDSRNIYGDDKLRLNLKGLAQVEDGKTDARLSRCKNELSLSIRFEDPAGTRSVVCLGRRPPSDPSELNRVVPMRTQIETWWVFKREGARALVNRVGGRIFPRFRRMQWSRLQPLWGRLGLADAGLQALMQEVEVRFAGHGTLLQEKLELARHLQEIMKQLEQWDTEAAVDEKAPVRVLCGTSAHQLEVCAEVSQSVAGLAETLTTHAAHLNRLSKHQHALLSIVAPLRMLRFGFRIEAATLPADLRGSFHGVTGEVGRLDEAIRESFESELEELRKTHHEAAATAKHLAQRAQELAVRAEQDQNIIRKTLEQVMAAQERSKRQNELVGRVAERVGEQVDTLVVSLQYQDITRQKLEHIRAGVADLQTQALSRDTSGVGRCVLSCRVQARQLEAVNSEIGTAGRQIAEGMQQILTELAQIHASSVDSTQDVHAEAALETLVPLLLDESMHLRASLASAIESLKSALTATRRFSMISSTAIKLMGRLAFDLKLMGLNAQIRALHVNNGGLEVLARETSDISLAAGGCIAEFEQGFQQAMMRLDQATLAVDARLRVFSELLEPEAEGGQDMLARLEQAEQRRRTAVDQAALLVRRIDQLAREPALAASIEQIDRTALTVAQAVLEELANALREKMNDADVGDSSEAHLRERYTMESERSIHRTTVSFIGGDDPSPRNHSSSDRPALEPGLKTSALNSSDDVEFF